MECFPKYWAYCELERCQLIDSLLPLAAYIASVNEDVQGKNPFFRLSDISDSYLISEFCRWKSISVGSVWQFAQANGFQDLADVIDAFRFAYLALKISRDSGRGPLTDLITALNPEHC